MFRITNILRNYGILLAFAVYIIIVGTLNPVFLSVDNLINVARQISINTIIAVGMTTVILSGGIDLSVGSILALVAVISGFVVYKDIGVVPAIFAGIILGGTVGWLNGITIAKLKIVPFITTLSTMTILRGVAFVVTQGKPVAPLTESYKFIGSGYLGPVPIPVIITVLVVIAGYYLSKNTTIGRYIYAIGGNEDATRLSGVNTDKVKIFVYTFSGILAGLAGIILSARLGSGDPKLGTMYELNAIAAVVLGGTSLSGGVGSVLGTVLGALIIGVLDNGLLLLQVSSYNQMVVKGLVILAAVFVDQMKKK